MESSLELAAIESFFSSVVLTLPRLFAIFAVVPFLSGGMLTGIVRNGLLLMLAIFMSPAAGEMPSASIGMWILITGKEALIGLMLGLGFGIFIWAIQSVGDLIDFQTGSANASFFDPVAGHENGPTGEFLSWMVITLFVSAGGLLAMLGVIVDSYRLWPVGSFFPSVGAVLEQFAIRQGDTLFLWIVKLASPVIFVLLLVELGMGLVGRVAPQLNVFVISQPLKSILAHFMMLLFVFFVYESLQEFLRPENSVLDFLRATL
ncbi:MULTISPECIES: type III secretion system export apparatus subunit SctT [unclassified Variovorax]|jgi:type III secretion protein T|uniref:type III secretion system export apparatus subunit SctT n=1 Tax=unclassified Variovorax TaxID=663243 RepID=UPI000890036D|nr:type III secretion system export apparatus subunit SctT [Variovorax sp. CF079]SDD81671.1 type III secretion protein T [Variovorax sp. CF079]